MFLLTPPHTRMFVFFDCNQLMDFSLVTQEGETRVCAEQEEGEEQTKNKGEHINSSNHDDG